MLKVGNHRIVVIVSDFALLVGPEFLGDYVSAKESVALVVDYYLASEDAYHISIQRVRVKGLTYLSNSIMGLNMSVTPSQDLYHLLEDWQINSIKNAARLQQVGYIDPDVARSPANEKVLQELGHNLTGTYEPS